MAFNSLWSTTPLPNISLDAAGLLALADLSAIAERTALTGSASYWDALILCPGIHRQQAATELNKGEYPATAALTTGYVFRTENQATVFFLQRASLTGHLTTLSVEALPSRSWFAPQALCHADAIIPRLLYVAVIWMTATAFALFLTIGDYWSVAILGILALARLLNIIVVRRRVTRGSAWKGKLEPGVQGDLLILLSQDRWVRLQGLVDDLKAVTSGLWLADPTFAESGATALATMLVYMVAALATNCTQLGSILLVVLLLLGTGLLALINRGTKALRMHGREVRVKKVSSYERRRVLADELIKETGRKDWAMGMGMVPPDEGETARVAVM